MSNDPNNPTSTDHYRKVTTDDLLKGQKSLVIQHGDNQYLLTVTRSNKLILTK